jgi:hypothetical protein
MRFVLAITLLLNAACAGQSVGTAESVLATGTMYFTMDMETETTMSGALFARFVPDSESSKHFPAATSGAYPGPVRHISLVPAEDVLIATVGVIEADRLSHGTKREIEVPVQVMLTEYKTYTECDSRVYYAKLMSVKVVGAVQVAAQGKAPHGC